MMANQPDPPDILNDITGLVLRNNFPEIRLIRLRIVAFRHWILFYWRQIRPVIGIQSKTTVHRIIAMFVVIKCRRNVLISRISRK